MTMMVTNKDRFQEWLKRAADNIYELRRKPRLSNEKKLEVIRGNYDVISVLTKVAKGDAFMLGIPPIDPAQRLINPEE